MRNHLICFLISCGITSFLMPDCNSAWAQEVSARLLGGRFAPQAAGKRIAFISNSEHFCTGTLVAPRLVLTAAHCLPPSIDPSDYSVFVGDEVVGAESLAVHPDYDENAPYEEAARYDLGMIKLSTPITGAAPVPILTGGRLSTNQTYYLAGYGANEKTSDTTRTWRDDFKFGATTLDNKDEFLILGSHISLGTSICAGDSGGGPQPSGTEDTSSWLG